MISPVPNLARAVFRQGLVPYRGCLKPVDTFRPTSHVVHRRHRSRTRSPSGVTRSRRRAMWIRLSQVTSTRGSFQVPPDRAQQKSKNPDTHKAQQCQHKSSGHQVDHESSERRPNETVQAPSFPLPDANGEYAICQGPQPR